MFRIRNVFAARSANESRVTEATNRSPAPVGGRLRNTREELVTQFVFVVGGDDDERVRSIELAPERFQ